MEHDGRPVGAGVVGAEIDIEGDGEVLPHIDALRRHRRTGLVTPPAVVRVKTLFATLALPCGVSVTALPAGGVTVTLTGAELCVVPSEIV